ncbi:DHHA1 domain-containing protein [Streptomyces sp. NPDC001401]|uniref:DHHA1 domain-containing protein n=1 Tax=Streptomyces sp. NPDC001401 TaxID=3364570 RepID=UPI00367F592B
MADRRLPPSTQLPLPDKARTFPEKAGTFPEKARTATRTDRGSCHTRHERRLLWELSDLLGTEPEDAPAVLRTRLALLADAQAEVERLHRAELASAAHALVERAHTVPGGLLVAARVDNTTGRKLRQLASAVAGRLSSGMGLVVLCTLYKGRALLVCAMGHRLRAQGVDARDVLREAAAAVGGSPAGRGARSSAAGPRTDELGRALSLARAEAVTLLRRSVG